jgi:hypothetical protein
MKIIHRVHCNKWGISHKSARKRASAEPSFTHNPSYCTDPHFRSTKGLAYDMYCYAQFKQFHLSTSNQFSQIMSSTHITSHKLINPDNSDH